MTDNLDKPSKHGLRRPPNEGSPRPKPPRKPLQPTVNDGSWPEHWPAPPGGYDQTPEMLDDEDAAKEQAIRHQGELDGLRRAARLMCLECDAVYADDKTGADHVRQIVYAKTPAGTEFLKWHHHYPDRDCRAGPIHTEIARLENSDLNAPKESGS